MSATGDRLKEWRERRLASVHRRGEVLYLGDLREAMVAALEEASEEDGTIDFDVIGGRHGYIRALIAELKEKP